MSDIMLTGKTIVKDASGKPIIITRLQRHQNNKYSSTFSAMKKMLDEKESLERITQQRSPNEEETK